MRLENITHMNLERVHLFDLGLLTYVPPANENNWKMSVELTGFMCSIKTCPGGCIGNLWLRASR